MLNGMGLPKPRRVDAPGMIPVVWKLAEKCWHHGAKEGPEVDVVLQPLERIADPGA